MLDKKYNWDLLELFFKKPTYPYHFREICRETASSPTKVRSGLERLKKECLILESCEKNLSIFRYNRDSESFRRLKILRNVSFAFEIADIIEKTTGYFDAIVFFGSARKGEDIEKSDFDVCVLGAKETDIDFSEIEKKINRKISLLFFESADRLRKENKELLNNLINGIVLKGYFRVFE